MAEDQDESQKTEEPTEKRLQDARQKGQVANSKEINNFLLLSAATLLVMTAAPWIGGKLKMTLTPFLSEAGNMHVDALAIGAGLQTMLGHVGLVMAVPFAALMIAAMTAGAVQTGLLVAVEPIKPKFSKISPLSGLKRLFSLKSIVEFIKNIAKITAAAAIGVAVVWPDRLHMVVAGRLPFEIVPGFLIEKVLFLLGSLSAALAVLAGLDYAYQKFEFAKQMRMSKRDIEDETKQSDGDPKIKARLRQLRMERARTRMMAAVPQSTVVITNPTHFAVALRYDQDQDPAPKVVAKGMDHLALRIRELARKANVPIVENPPLARALHRSIELGSVISQEHYQAVAEVIGYVMRLEQNAQGHRKK